MREQIEWGSGRLHSVRDLTSDIRLIEIEPAPGEFVVPPPGSHINVVVQIGEKSDMRSYSTVGPCTDGVYRIAVKKLANSRGGSAYMWTLAPGARLTVSKPRNHFELGHGRPEYLLLAGGIGITPIFTMALALAQAGANFRVLYACRKRQDLALADELREQIGDRLHVVVDEEGATLDLTSEIAALAPGGELYMCGPIGMLEAVKQHWQQSGRRTEQLRFETFGNSGRYATESFTVKIPRLNIEFNVQQNQTLLEALEAAGVGMISDCRRGECGLCALPIIETAGTVDHRDVFFSDAEKAENAKLCTCVSRVSGGSITIDTADRAA
jgi:ferredoxin-NADP reductase